MNKIMLIVLVSTVAQAEIETFCCDRSAKNEYIMALKEMGVPAKMQNFKGSEWDAVPATSIYSRGVTYLRTDGNYVTLTAGNAIYGVNPAGTRHAKPEGFTMVADGPLYGYCAKMDGWRLEAEFELDGSRLVDWPENDNDLLYGNPKWLCFTDTVGFQTLRIFNEENPDENLRLFAWNLKLGGPYSGTVNVPVIDPPDEEEDEEEDEQVCEWNDEDQQFDCEDE